MDKIITCYRQKYKHIEIIKKKVFEKVGESVKFIEHNNESEGFESIIIFFTKESEEINMIERTIRNQNNNFRMEEKQKINLLKRYFLRDGNIDLSNIDLGNLSFKASRLKASNIWNNEQKAKYNMYNNNQESKESIWNNSQQSLYISNNHQKAKKTLENNSQSGSIINNTYQLALDKIYF